MPETSEYNPKMSWKSLVQAIGLIVVIGGGFQVWGQTQNRINELEKDLVKQIQDNQLYESRLRQLETTNARADERFNLLLTMMSEMKSDIAALRQAVRN